MLLHTALCAAVIICLIQTAHGSSVTSYDICKTKTLQLNSVGKSGILTFDNTSKNHEYSCVLKIEACSSCQIELRPAAKSNFDFKCPIGAISLRYCTLGCDYLYMFDTNYMNETMQFYQSLGKYQEPFKSESKSVFILLCHGFSEDYSFQIAYNTTRKLTKIRGISDSSLAFGYISSPYFPLGYAQSQEVYEYQFNSTEPGDYVQLMFDDWHLPESAVFFFDKSNIKTQVSGRTSRPVVISDKNFLRFTFQTGVSRAPGENRDYLGFRASYKFYSSRIEIPHPKTSCGPESYYMSDVGGKIKFTTNSPTREIYDCLWVLKKKAGFDGIFMKIVEFSSNTHGTDPSFAHNTLMIRDGVTSIGPVVQVVKMSQLLDSDDAVAHFSNVGFYLRLNGVMSSVITLTITFASYKENPGCTSLFVCDNRRCIDHSLVCDGTDHCGDNSDEVAGCGGDDSTWDKSYQYTITIGVIVPMVISVFLIMVICLLFVMIRRCRRAQLREAAGSNERLRTVSEEVSEQHGGRRRRRRRRGLFGQGERDLPPTYDEAMQNPPGWYQNVAFGNPVDPTLPQPPSYHEAIGGQNPEQSTSNQHNTPGSPVSTDSSQSELTMCSANLSDSSSSSDEGSTWGMYSGEGEGRRGRLGRHVSSSGSETYTTVDQSQSTIPSPNQNETVPVNASHDNISHVSSPDIEMRNIHDNDNHRVKRDNKSHEKNRQKVASSEPDDFVVPAGPKPGGSDSSVNCQPRPRGPDVILFRDSRKPSTSAPRPAPRKSLDYRKNATHETEAAMATRNEQNQENPKPPKRADTNAAYAYDRSDSSCQESENTDIFYDAGNSVTVGASNAYPNEYRQHQNKRESSPSGLVIESSPAQHRSVHEGIEGHLQNRAVVNVDDDEVIYMYDSQNSINRSGIVPSQYLLSQAQGTDQRNVSYERNPHSNGAVRRRADVGKENVDRVSQRYPPDNRHLDDSPRSAGHITQSTDQIWDDTVTSAGHMTSHVDRHFDDSVTSAGSSDQLSFSSRIDRGSGCQQLQSSHLSLNAEFDDLEDVYV